MDTTIQQMQRNARIFGESFLFIEWDKNSSHPSKSLNIVECELYHLTICHPKIIDFKSNLKRLKDDRISYENNNKIGIVAEFKTKSGNKILSSF